MSINLNDLPNESISDKAKAKGKKQTQSFGFLTKEISLSRKKFNNARKEEFYSETSLLMESGLDIRSIFYLILQEKKKDKYKSFYEATYNRLVEGDNLSVALNKTGQITAYEYYSIQIGEETGKLNEILKDLSVYFNERIKQKRQLVSAFSYPLMVISTAVVVVVFMLNYIVPMFKDVFARFNGELPGLTRFILSVSQTMKHYIGWFILFLSGLIILIALIRKTEKFRKLSSTVLLKIPYWGPLLNKIYLARFSHSMALMSSAHVPMITALQLMEKIIAFYPFEKAMSHISDDLMNGKLLHESMTKFPFFDRKIISLTKVGEEVNQLSAIYSKLSQQYNEEVRHQTEVLSNLMEPLLIIVVGFMVAVILIAMYMPMFQMGSSFI